MKPGDVVIIQDSNQVRGSWKKGIVVIANPSNDGRVRRVQVKYKQNNSSTMSIVERPVQKLILLVPVEEQ